MALFLSSVAGVGIKRGDYEMNRRTDAQEKKYESSAGNSL